jgi:hypothetical protein
LTRYIHHRRAYRVVALRLNDRLVVALMHKRFARGPQAGFDQDAIGAKHERGGKDAPVSDAARRKEQGMRGLRGHKISRFGNEGQRPAEGAMTARIGS